MPGAGIGVEASEEEFAGLAASLAAEPGRLLELLREDHPVFDQRGTATISRMRGWVILTLARAGLPDAALPFVLEELDTGTDSYLVAAAAHALRCYREPRAAFAPFVAGALQNIYCKDDPVSFDGYGEYAVGSGGTTAVLELVETLLWLGPHAHCVRDGFASLAGDLPVYAKGAARKALQAMDGGQSVESDCCGVHGRVWWRPLSRPSRAAVESVTFEDHSGQRLSFSEQFTGQPSILAFFYTRCDNPLKCSLTIEKLGRVQRLLEARGAAFRIRTAAITYDPGFDSPQRLRKYGEFRGLLLDSQNRMLRATNGSETLQRYFGLGVNFVGSLVNRHRLELFIIDREGRIAASFQRLRWDENEVVERAIEVAEEGASVTQAARPAWTGAIPALALALFPKCPVCWAAYLSMLGIAGLHLPYPSGLTPLLMLLTVVNLASVWWRARATRRIASAALVSAGAAAILISTMGSGAAAAAYPGVALTLIGGFLSVAGRDAATKIHRRG